LPSLGIAVLFGLLIFAASGCGFFQEEILPNDPMGLMSLGREKMKAQRYGEAKKQFERVLESTPDNELRVQALMNLADTFFKNREYEEARFQYRKFLELYPVHSLAPRAQFQLAMCSFAEIKMPDRDQNSTIEALRQFQRFLTSYPDHPLVPEAEEKVQFSLNRLAEHDLEVSRFYYRQGKFHSVITRLRDLLEKYPDFSQNDEALYLLGQSYREEESLDKAQAVFARLVNEHPESQYAPSAKRALSKWQKKGG
jgi:outer membrane protein assembly factor BamD